MIIYLWAQSAAGAPVLVAPAAPTTVVVAVARLVLRAAAEGRPELLGSLDIADHLLDDVGDQELTLGRLGRLGRLQVTLIIPAYSCIAYCP